MICRPGGRDDVPFRSVASRLVRVGADGPAGLGPGRAAPADVRPAGGRCCGRRTTRAGRTTWCTSTGTAPTSTVEPAGAGGRRCRSVPRRYGPASVAAARRARTATCCSRSPDRDEQPAAGRRADAGRRCWSRPGCRCWCSTPAAPPTPRPPTAPQTTDARRDADVHARVRGLRVAGRGGRRRRAWPGWWRCATTSTSSPPPSSSPTSTPACWPDAAARRGGRPPAAGSWPPSPTRAIAFDPLAAAGLGGARRLRSRAAAAARPLPPTRPARITAGRRGGTGRGRRRGARGRRMSGSSAATRPCWRWTGRSTPHRIVLLHAFAGAGKTTTAAEFARWYTATGGLADRRRPMGWCCGPRSSTTRRWRGCSTSSATAFDAAAGGQRHPLAGASPTPQRRDLALQVLAQVPVLWVWDNVEPVAGFPAGTPSAWTADEQAGAAPLPARPATRPRRRCCSPRGATSTAGWATCPPGSSCRRCRCANASSSPRPSPTATATGSTDVDGLAAAAAVHRRQPADHHRAGPPGAARAGSPPRHQIEAVRRPAAGRRDRRWTTTTSRRAAPRSLAASLAYGFTHAFTDAERAQLAVLHLFRDTVDVDALRSWATPTSPATGAGAGRADPRRRHRPAGPGRRASACSPASAAATTRSTPPCPGTSADLFTTTTATRTAPPPAAGRAYTTAIAALGDYYHRPSTSEGRHRGARRAAAEEANLLHARTLARRARPVGPT